MLVEQIVGALGAPFIRDAFGFGAPEPRAVDVGLFRRPISLRAFPESLQVD
jgi:hypothetical protein